MVINGKTWKRVFDGSSYTVKTISPLGRTTTMTLDAKGRVTNIAVPSLNPVAFAYDSHGRLSTDHAGVRADDGEALVAQRTRKGR